MSLRRFFLIQIVFFLALSAQAISAMPAQEHAHSAPHGGVVKEGGGMHLELVVDKNGQPTIYVYDNAMKPLTQGDLQAKLTLKGHGGVQNSQDLQASKDSKGGIVLKGKPMKGAADWESADLNLKTKDRSTDIQFSNQTHGKSGHSH
jgi:hypothetical protein